MANKNVKPVKLDKANIAIHRLASKEDNRYTCDSVRLDTDATVATNGHYLAVVGLPEQDEGTTVEPLNIASQSMVNVEKMTTKRNSGVVMLDGRMVAEKGDVSVRENEGQFPNWRAVIPKTQGFCFRVDAGKLRQLADVLERVCGNPIVQVTFESENAETCAIRFDGLTDSGLPVTALLMPCVPYKKEERRVLPDWQVKDDVKVEVKAEAKVEDMGKFADGTEIPTI